MNIEDIDIKIKKYDREKNVVYVNLVLLSQLEIRGFVVRYTTTKFTSHAIWIVTPPSVPTGKGKDKKYFWICEFTDKEFWKKLQNNIIQLTKEYTNAV